ARLMAVHGDDDSGTRLQPLPRGRRDLDRLIGRDISRFAGREDAVDVDLGVLVVIEQELDAGQVGRGRQRHVATEPDVWLAPPGRALDAGSPGRPDPGGALPPPAIVEVGPAPVVRRASRRVPPGDRLIA